MAKKGTWTEKISPAMHTVLWPLKVEKDLDHDRWTILGEQFELRNFEIIKELLNEGFFMNECFSNFQVFEVSLSEERYLTQLLYESNPVGQLVHLTTRAPGYRRT